MCRRFSHLLHLLKKHEPYGFAIFRLQRKQMSPKTNSKRPCALVLPGAGLQLKVAAGTPWGQHSVAWGVTRMMRVDTWQLAVQPLDMGAGSSTQMR